MTVEQPAGTAEATAEPVDEPLLTDRGLLTLLVLDGALLGVVGLAFTPLYLGVLPVPLGAVASILLLPWLVGRAGELDIRPGLVGAPLIAWAIMVGTLGLLGPGGDVLLPVTWQSLLLLFGGLGAGLWRLRRVRP